MSCPNCGAELLGKYCHACGQKSGVHLGFHDFIHDATHEFLHLDGKILQSVRLLALRPGFLTSEFLAGRRARYITPLRLYLTFSLIFFALAALFPQEQSIVQAGTGKNRAPANAEEERMADEVGSAIMKQLPRAMFVLMPVFAALTWLFYRRGQPLYVPHLYYSVHFHAFVFFILALMMLLGLAGRYGKMAGALLFMSVIPYHYIALRRVFGGTRARTLVKGTLIGLLYVGLISALMVALLLFLMRSFNFK